MVVPDGIDGCGCGEVAEFRTALPSIITILLYGRSCRVVDIHVVAEKKKCKRMVCGNRIPHSFVVWGVSCSAAEADLEFGFRAGSRESAERPSFRLLVAIYQQFVVILCIRFQSLYAHNGCEVSVLACFRESELYRRYSILRGANENLHGRFVCRADPEFRAGVSDAAKHRAVQKLDCVFFG